MFKLRILACLIWCVLPIQQALAAPVQVVDAAGRQVQLSAPAQRILSLSPHLTENLFALGAGAQVVGVVEFSNYPPEAQKLPVVGSYSHLDLEQILQLQPDLIVAWHSGNPKKQMAKLESLGVPVFYSEPRTFAELFNELRQLGQLSGHETAAKELVKGLQLELNFLREKYFASRKVKAFYQVAFKPLITLNSEHLISQALQVCNAENVFGSLNQLAPLVSLEAVFKANPEVIFAGVSPEDATGWHEPWQKFKHLSAANNQHLYNLPADIISRPTPRLVHFLGDLCSQVNAVRSSQNSKPK